MDVFGWIGRTEGRHQKVRSTSPSASLSFARAHSLVRGFSLPKLLTTSQHMAALSSRLCLASVPLPRLRPLYENKRGALQVVAAKKNKRKEERKAKKKAETKALLAKHNNDSKGNGLNDADNDVAAKPKGPAPFESTVAVMQSLTICGSYKEKTNDKLLDGTLMVQEAAEALWNAPFVCASHDASDVFNYGNKAALSLWGLSWDEFVGLPSTKSADEADDAIQSERRALLDKAAATGIIEDYSGIRQTSEGRRFKINGATVWTINDRDGNKKGQAVRFDSFIWLNPDSDSEGEEMIVTDGGKIRPKASVGNAEAVEEDEEAPSSADIEAASAAVEKQAKEVRRLKEDEGLTNSDKEVQAAVSELLDRKRTLAALEEKM